jgi:hypothetical protein
MLWLFLFCLSIMPVLAFRAEWHYYVIYYALAAVFAGQAICSFFQRTVPGGKWRRAGAAWASVLLLHCGSIWLAAQARMFDAEQYQFWRPYYEAIDSLEPGERIGLIDTPSISRISGGTDYYTNPEHPVSRSFKDLFVPLSYPLSKTTLEKHSIKILITNCKDGSPLRVFRYRGNTLPGKCPSARPR